MKAYHKVDTTIVDIYPEFTISDRQPHVAGGPMDCGCGQHLVWYMREDSIVMGGKTWKPICALREMDRMIKAAKEQTGGGKPDEQTRGDSVATTDREKGN